MLLNGIQQICRSAIVQEIQALPDAPQGRGPEFVWTGRTLRNSIG
jgi:hypothetical protein